MATNSVTDAGFIDSFRAIKILSLPTMFPAANVVNERLLRELVRIESG